MEFNLENVLSMSLTSQRFLTESVDREIIRRHFVIFHVGKYIQNVLELKFNRLQ